MLYPTSAMSSVLCSIKDHISLTVKQLFPMLLNSSVPIQEWKEKSEAET